MSNEVSIGAARKIKKEALLHLKRYYRTNSAERDELLVKMANTDSILDKLRFIDRTSMRKNGNPYLRLGFDTLHSFPTFQLNGAAYGSTKSPKSIFDHLKGFSTNVQVDVYVSINNPDKCKKLLEAISLSDSVIVKGAQAATNYDVAVGGEGEEKEYPLDVLMEAMNTRKQQNKQNMKQKKRPETFSAATEELIEHMEYQYSLGYVKARIDEALDAKDENAFNKWAGLLKNMNTGK